MLSVTVRLVFGLASGDHIGVLAPAPLDSLFLLLYQNRIGYCIVHRSSDGYQLLYASVLVARDMCGHKPTRTRLYRDF